MVAGARSDYSLTKAAALLSSSGKAAAHGVDGVWTLTHKGTGAVTTLAGVERLRFEDQAVALDTAVGGSLQPAKLLLAAVFGASALSDAGLLGQFLAQVDALGPVATAQLIEEIGLVQKLASGTSMADVLTLLYHNVEGRAPSAAELQALLAWQKANSLSVADLVLIAAQHQDLASQVAAAQKAHGESAGAAVPVQPFTELIVGTTSADHIAAVTGLAQSIDGREGIDSLQVQGKAADYLLSYQSGGRWQLTPVTAVKDDAQTDTPADASSAASTSQTSEATAVTQAQLLNVERIDFSDHSLALDLLGNAGTAAKMLVAVLGLDALHSKALVGEAIAYIDQMGAQTWTQLAQTSGYLDKVADGSSMQALIGLLYENIAGRSATQGDVQWTMELAQQQGWDRADLLMYAVQLPDAAARIDLAGLAQTGLEFDIWKG